MLVQRILQVWTRAEAEAIYDSGREACVELREEILRLLAAAADAGRGTLTLWDVDERLTDKPEGTSIRRVVEELAREKLIAIRSGDPRQVSLTREGRARARRRRDVDRGEHAVSEPEQLLDLVYRARVGGLTRASVRL